MSRADVPYLPLSQMATDTRAAETGVCPRCGCRDTRSLLGTDGRRFIGCRFCFTPRPAMQPAPPAKKRSKPR